MYDNYINANTILCAHCEYLQISLQTKANLFTTMVKSVKSAYWELQACKTTCMPTQTVKNTFYQYLNISHLSVAFALLIDFAYWRSRPDVRAFQCFQGNCFHQEKNRIQTCYAKSCIMLNNQHAKNEYSQYYCPANIYFTPVIEFKSNGK